MSKDFEENYEKRVQAAIDLIRELHCVPIIIIAGIKDRSVITLTNESPEKKVKLLTQCLAAAEEEYRIQILGRDSA